MHTWSPEAYLESDEKINLGSSVEAPNISRPEEQSLFEKATDLLGRKIEETYEDYMSEDSSEQQVEMSPAKVESTKAAQRIQNFLDDVLKSKGGKSTDANEFINLYNDIEALPEKVRGGIPGSLKSYVHDRAFDTGTKRHKGSYDETLKSDNTTTRERMHKHQSRLELKVAKATIDAYITPPIKQQQSSTTATPSRGGRFVIESPEETSSSKQTKKPGWYQTAVTALTGGKSSKQQETDPYSPHDLSDVFSPEEPGMFGRVKEWWSGETSEDLTSGDSDKEQQVKRQGLPPESFTRGTESRTKSQQKKTAVSSRRVTPKKVKTKKPSNKINKIQDNEKSLDEALGGGHEATIRRHINILLESYNGMDTKELSTKTDYVNFLLGKDAEKYFKDNGKFQSTISADRFEDRKAELQEKLKPEEKKEEQKSSASRKAGVSLSTKPKRPVKKRDISSKKEKATRESKTRSSRRKLKLESAQQNKPARDELDQGKDLNIEGQLKNPPIGSFAEQVAEVAQRRQIAKDSEQKKRTPRREKSRGNYSTRSSNKKWQQPSETQMETQKARAVVGQWLKFFQPQGLGSCTMNELKTNTDRFEKFLTDSKEALANETVKDGGMKVPLTQYLAEIGRAEIRAELAKRGGAEKSPTQQVSELPSTHQQKQQAKQEEQQQGGPPKVVNFTPPVSPRKQSEEEQPPVSNKRKRTASIRESDERLGKKARHEVKVKSQQQPVKKPLPTPTIQITGRTAGIKETNKRRKGKKWLQQSDNIYRDALLKRHYQESDADPDLLIYTKAGAKGSAAAFSVHCQLEPGGNASFMPFPEGEITAEQAQKIASDIVAVFGKDTTINLDDALSEAEKDLIEQALKEAVHQKDPDASYETFFKFPADSGQKKHADKSELGADKGKGIEHDNDFPPSPVTPHR